MQQKLEEKMMTRVFITGDKHGDHVFIEDFCNNNPSVTRDDVLIILGDAGYNFFLDYAEHKRRKQIAKNPITVFCVHGNHEERPYNIKGYREIDIFHAKAYQNKKYPNLIFAKDGEYYTIGKHNYFVIGGAYSTDKYLRLKEGWKWFPSEQADWEIMETVNTRIEALNNQLDIVLTHTCPKKYIGADLKYVYQDENEVDDSMEKWLDTIEDRITYNHWYFGHFHMNRSITKTLDVLYDAIIEIEQ